MNNNEIIKDNIPVEKLYIELPKGNRYYARECLEDIVSMANTKPNLREIFIEKYGKDPGNIAVLGPEDVDKIVSVRFTRLLGSETVPEDEIDVISEAMTNMIYFIMFVANNTTDAFIVVLYGETSKALYNKFYETLSLEDYYNICLFCKTFYEDLEKKGMVCKTLIDDGVDNESTI